MNSGVYRIICLVTNLIYIGSSVNLKSRRRGHFNDKYYYQHNPHLRRAFKKYGKENFKFEVLEYCAPEKFLSMEDAQRKLKIDASAINRICLHKRGYNAGGFTWMFKKDYLLCQQ